MKILLLGEKESKKSQILWTLFKKSNCGGIICIPVFQGTTKIGKDAIDMTDNRRHVFCRIKEIAEFDGIPTEKYIISEAGIQFCIDALKKSVEKDLIIVDEFGPLELQGGGIYQIAKEIIESEKNVIIVLRKNLEKRFLERFPYLFEKLYLNR
jgi:nucleoside-triphosphatase THEP1